MGGGGEFGAELRAHFGARLHYCKSIDSTQQAALAGGRAGADEGALFVAEQQTAGRGRHGHRWESPAGAGIYASLLLRPQRPAAKLLWLTLAAGLGVADAVAEACGVEAEIRWPNDLLLGGKKFCGLLLETDGSAAALGFGINVGNIALPRELAAIATSLEQHSERPCPRGKLAAAVVKELLRRYAVWNAGHDEALREEFEQRSRYARGLAVTVSGEWGGVSDGLDGDGFLRVRTPEGAVRIVVSGDVRPATAS